MPVDPKSVLRYLQIHAGKSLSIKEIRKRASSPTRDDKKPKNRRKLLDKEKYSLPELEEFLKILSEYELISFHENYSKIKIRDPFLVEANFVVSRSGNGFGMGKFSKDIFIPIRKRFRANPKDKVSIRLTDMKKNRFEGEVITILKRFSESFLGKVIEDKNSFSLVQLIDLPDRPVYILRSKEKLSLNSYVVLKPLKKTQDIYMRKKSSSTREKKILQKLYTAELVKRQNWVTETDQIFSDLQRMAIKYALAIEYPKGVIPSTREVQEKYLIGLKDRWRRNLTKTYACTIDGDDAKDFDDAISLEKEKEITKLYVHIADVSFFVSKDSPLDQEALKRSNSYYLKPHVLPMLPNILSEEYCSLKPKTKRLAFTCEMRFDRKGNLLSYIFYNSIIYLNRRFTYDEAEKEIAQSQSKISEFWKFAKLLKEKRLRRGGIDLELPETEFRFDKGNKILGLNERQRLKTHQLIEEFMLAANVCAAQFCRKNKIPTIFRVHESMDKKSWRR